MGVCGAGAYCVLPYTSERGKADNKVFPSVTDVITADSTYFLGMGGQTVKIPANASSLVFSLSTPEHLYAGRVTFAYRLGKDGGWTTLEQGQNRVYLNRLPKGETELYVRATDRYGNWGKERLCLTVDRLPLWHETWWARALFVVAGVLVLALLLYIGKGIMRLRGLMRLRDDMSLKHVDIMPEDISNERWNSEFAQRLLHTIEEHLGDVDYNVTKLADDMSMSRASLFRRTKATTGGNPTDLIREVRLKKAAEMLQQDSKASVTDIAQKVGFSTPQYFARCFKKMFGMQPGQYRESKTANSGQA